MSLDLMCLMAIDCRGDERSRSPTTWNHMYSGKSQAGPIPG
jgi:hypothetical protein